MTKKSDRNILIRLWLWRYYDAKRDTVRLKQEYEELCSIQESAAAIRYTDRSGSGSTETDLSDQMVMRDEILSRLLAAKRKEARIYCEIMRAISKLDFSTERDVISLRYLNFSDGLHKSSWEEIAAAMNFSPSHVKRVHGIALRKLLKIVGDRNLRKMIRNDTF